MLPIVPDSNHAYFLRIMDNLACAGNIDEICLANGHLDSLASELPTLTVVRRKLATSITAKRRKRAGA